MPTHARLLAAIRAFVEADSWAESREILERHPELLAEDATAALDAFGRQAEERGDSEMAHTFRVHLRLLGRCAEVGTVAAFLELDAPAEGRPPGPGLEVPREVLTDDVLELSREVWASAPHTESSQWWKRRVELLERGVVMTEGNPEAAPMWATFHVELANTLLNTPVGDRSANIERAIASFETAARVWTRDVAPQQWATIQENLGKAYDQRILGDPEENRERANSFYEKAGVAVDDDHDDELTSLVQEFGDPLAPGGPRRRIEVCERVIQLLTPPVPAVEELWVGAHATLAENLAKLSDGDRAENIERAVCTLESALAVADEHRHPEGWAAAHAVLGVILFDRIGGDRAENIERAVRAFELSMHVRTRQTDPLAWAATANNLANAYGRRSRGDRASNLEKAIGLLDAAMAIRTKDRMPEQWATTVANLGIVYSQRVLGSRAENLEQAIQLFEDALEVLTPEREPARWAGTTRNLANALCERVLGDKEADLAIAIAHYERALDATPRSANPGEWAATMIGLGNAYAVSATERVERLERAIAAFEAATDVLDPASLPEPWVAARVGMANTYLDRVRGGRAENVEQAIRYLDEGLAVAARETMPREWAALHHVLVQASANRRRGDPAVNLQRAVAAGKAALEVRTRAADPGGWVATSQNLASVLMRPELPGDRSDHREEARALLEAAMEVVSREAMPLRWAQMRSSLGIVYAKRLVGDRATNLRKAVSAFSDVLTAQRKGSVEWAKAQRNLGTAYGDLAQLDGDPPRTELVAAAFSAFAAALPILQSHGRVVETWDTSKSWGDLAFRLGRWRDAASAYEVSMDAADILYAASADAAGKRSELDESIAVCQRAALARVYAAEPDGAHDDLVSAVVAVERSRARWLGETLAQDQADLAEAEKVDGHAVARYRAAAARLRKAEDEERRSAEARSRDDVAGATEELLTARLRDAGAELTASVEGIRSLGYRFATFLVRPGFGAVDDALRPGQAIAYLLVTGRGSCAVLAHRPTGGPPVLSSVRAPLTAEELVGMLLAEDGEGGFLAGQNYAPHALGALLTTALPALGERLIAPIARRLRELGAREVTLVPCGLLGTLPLHAALYGHGGAALRLIDEFDVSYSPSARVLAHARSLSTARSAGAATLAGVADPTPRSPLEHAHRELRDVAALFRDARALYGADATSSALTSAATNATYVHLACHGEFDVLHPLESGLELADGRLTVRDVLATRPFRAARIVVASACKTAVTDLTDLPDEVVGLPAGILCGGTPGVVGTLWSVDDRSTALLMHRFYAYHRTGDPTTGEPPMPPARALRHAQRWLSTATPADLAGDGIDRSARDVTPAGVAASGVEQTSTPFSDPFYWAPFVFLGA